MEGRSKRRDYEKKHNSSTCHLFMSSELNAKGGPVSKLGWGNSQDRPTNKTPYGCPKGHLYIDVDPPSNNDTKSSIQSSSEASVPVQKSPTIPSAKGIVRPEREVAVRRKRIIEDTDDDDDSFDDPLFDIPSEDISVISEQGKTKKEKPKAPQRGKKFVNVDYDAPEVIKDQCLEEQKKRHAKMNISLRTAASSDQWIPDAQDEEDERTIFIARDMVNQKNWAQAQYEMNPESKERMKKGLEPLIEEDKTWVTQTPGYVMRKL